MHRFLLLSLSLFWLASSVFAQKDSKITGNFQSNVNFFMTDSTIGAFGTPQYDNQKFGTESWLNLNYSNWGYDMSVRFDMFGNSNLPNPTQSFTAQGIGRWYIRKPVGNFDFSGGYIYDQIGSGIIFRAYEERTLAIDNALYGLRVGYKINDNWSARAFTGRQKFRFDTYGSVMRGATIEGFVKADSTGNLSFAPGVGVVARTFDDATINSVVNSLATTPLRDREGAQYNTYTATVFNRTNYKALSWYIEAAGKTNDVMYNPLEERTAGGIGRLVNRPGYVLYSALTYANKGLGISLENKITKDFNFRTSPFEQGFRGMINLLPPMTRNNTYRLTTRYVPATQEFGELSHQLDVKYRINKQWNTAINFSNITTLDGDLLYREVYPEITWKPNKKLQAIGGVQFQRYNQLVYEGKNDMVNTVVPFTEWFYKISTKRSVRVEAQYLNTKDDFGAWAWGLVEVGLAPHWLFWVSDMYKVPHASDTDANGKPLSPEKTKFDGIHYPTFGIVYTQKATRLSLAYVKQVEGLNCAGGICRYEPTFRGVRLNVNTSF